MFSADELLNAAREARAKAYAPYSKFEVGAAVDVGDGVLFAGSNVENASYGLSICAERNAVCAAVNAGYRKIAAIAVAGPRGTTTVPCGACRQFINEFGPHVPVTYTTPDGVETKTLDELLPCAFGPQNLTP